MSALPHSTADDERLTAANLFHRVNSVIPDDQELIAVDPDSMATEALETMKRTGFSQLPVVVGKEVLGVFSYRSFSRAVIEHARLATEADQFSPLDLTVDECVESPTFVRVTDELNSWFDSLDEQDALLVGDPGKLMAIVTGMDVLRYLYGVASPFVLVAEVELALRALIQIAVDSETLARCATEVLTKYNAKRRPTVLEDMVFNDYIQLIGHEDHWAYFQPVFRGNIIRTRAKLDQLRSIRNTVFHFKRGLTSEEYDVLAAGRDWMLRKVRDSEAQRREAAE